MEYMNELEEHKSQGKYGFQGTPLFASISALTGFTQSRRDDVQALGQVFMYMVDSENIPWRNIEDYRKILPEK
jgi:hypothetical protein